MEKHPLQIKTPELQTSPEVQDAVAKKERLEKSKLPNDPNERIEAYMERLENIFLNPDERVRERNLEMLRDKIYNAFIIKRENVPESYFELQKRIARERGQSIDEIPRDMKERMIDTVVEDQKHSLDSWINYLTSNDAKYPTWYKYFVFRNIVNLSQFDKELGKFKVRTASTTAPFPDRYEEPLAKICDVYLKVAEDNKNLKDPEIKETFSKRFPSLYAELIQKSLKANLENKEEIKGEWIKYEKGDMRGADRLFKSLEDKGTGWCTAGKATALAQVESGDFYVYYTYDDDNNPTQPRVAIRMEDDRIAEVRGRLPHQSLEPQMNEVLDTKLSEFGPEADKFKKKSADMKLLTEIDKKSKAGQLLTKEDLVFLYEMESNIEGFGYGKDPRIEEIREKRNTGSDYAVIFDCKPEDIVVGRPDLITPTTKVYSFGGENIDYKVLPLLRPDIKMYAELPNNPIEFVNPKDIDYKKLVDQPDIYKNGTQTINPEMVNIDLEKAKVFVPDLSQFNDKPLHEVMQYAVDTYGSKYKIAGLEYRDFMLANPALAPKEFKDTNLHFFFFGSVSRDSSGDWNAPRTGWDGRVFHRRSFWLGFIWRSNVRLVLLEI